MRWSWLLGVALLAPAALPAGGAERRQPEVRRRDGSGPLISGDHDCLHAAPSVSAPSLRSLDLGTPLRVLRRWRSADGQDWLRYRWPLVRARIRPANPSVAGCMADLLPFTRQVVLVGLGAIPGAWLRLRVVNHFEPVVPRKHWGTFVVNVVAAFGLGLVLGLNSSTSADSSSGSHGLTLLIGTGFFGSLSTFSTFAVELLNCLRAQQWMEALVLALGSILGGLLMAAAGYALGVA